MLASRIDRNEIRSLHAMPSESPKFDAESANSVWRNAPTPISRPQTRQSTGNRDSHMPSAHSKDSDPFNPYSQGRMRATLPLRAGSRKRGKAFDQRESGGLASSPLPANCARKRAKLESGRPSLGAEIIDVDRENREASSPDPINVFDIVSGTPRLASEISEKVHAFDLSSNVTSPGNSRGMASRLPQDGPATKFLEQRLTRSSPIEQFENDPPQEPSAPGRVKNMVSQIENVAKQVQEAEGPPHVDLRTKVKKNMKPKSLLDPVATSSSGFIPPKYPEKLQVNSEYSIPVKECYIGSKHIPNDFMMDPISLAWQGGGKELLISYTAEKQRCAPIAIPTKDMECAACTVSSTPFRHFVGMPVLKIEMDNPLRARLPDSQPDSASVDWESTTITILLDTSAAHWSTVLYDSLASWLKSQGVKIERSRGGKQMWEMAELNSKASNQDQNASEQMAKLTRPNSDVRPMSVARSDSNTSPGVPSTRESDIASDQPLQLRRSARHTVITIKKPRLSVDPDEVILVYPQGVPGAINITNADVSRLQPGEFLNDTVIEFGLKLWHKELESSNSDLAKDVHVFSSFFYKKLNKKNFEEGYQSIRKWTSKINLFEKKYIIIPINEHLHWYLAIIYMPQYMLQPPPLQQVKQSPASRTRSRTNRVAKETGGADPPADDTLSAAVVPMIDTDNQFKKNLDEFQGTIIPTTSMDALPERDHPGPRLLPTLDEFAMDVDKFEEDDVREQLRLSSPLSEVPTDNDPSRGSRTVVEDMDVEIGMSSEKTAHTVSRFFFDGVNSSIIELDSQGQQRIEKSVLEPQEQMNQEEDPGEQTLGDDGEQDDDGSGSSSRTYIFTLDSLGTRHPQAIKQLNKYLKMEALDKLNNSNTSDAIGKAVPVPTQPNFCDCGIYLLHFAQMFMTDPARYFKLINGSKKPPPASDRQVIWQDHKVGTLRQGLADRIKELSEEWKKTRQEAKKDQMETLPSSESEIEYVETTPATAQEKGKTPKGNGRRYKTERTSRLRG